MKRRKVLAACGAAVLLVCLTSCVSLRPTACAMVGISDSVLVSVVGDTAAVTDVGYCDGLSPCSPRGLSVVNRDGTPTPLPAHHGGDEWNVPTGNHEARYGRVAAYDHAGDTLAERVEQLHWTNEGTAQCPGPYSTHITLRVPADR